MLSFDIQIRMCFLGKVCLAEGTNTWPETERYIKAAEQAQAGLWSELGRGIVRDESGKEGRAEGLPGSRLCEQGPRPVLLCLVM